MNEPTDKTTAALTLLLDELVDAAGDWSRSLSDSDHDRMHAARERIEGFALAAQPQPAPAGSIPVPRNADEAAGMALIGEAWLRHNAPERLRQPAPAVPSDAEIDDCCHEVTGRRLHHDEKLLTFAFARTLLARYGGQAGSTAWRCFQCGETFTDPSAAEEHFGRSQHQAPACTIDVAEYRRMEEASRRYCEEDTDLHRQISGMESSHQQALMRAEEKGYATGLKDGGQAGALERDAWVPVSERMPANPEWHEDAPRHVLCYSETHDWAGKRLEVFDASDFYVETEHGGFGPTFDAEAVTHWMPLPTPPTADAQPAEGEGK